MDDEELPKLKQYINDAVQRLDGVKRQYEAIDWNEHNKGWHDSHGTSGCVTDFCTARERIVDPAEDATYRADKIYRDYCIIWRWAVSAAATL